MTYENTFKYLFATVLALIGGYGFITGIESWQLWLAGSIAYLTISKLVSIVYE